MSGVRYERIIADIRGGATREQMRVEYGMNDVDYDVYVKAATGMLTPPRVERDEPQRWNRNERELIARELRRAGMSVPRIAGICGVSARTVHKYLAGIKRP